MYICRRTGEMRGGEWGYTPRTIRIKKQYGGAKICSVEQEGSGRLWLRRRVGEEGDRDGI